jgi:hypothetical protein
MKRIFLIGMAGISLALGMMVIGCDEDSDDGGGGSASSVKDAQVYLENGTEYTGSGTVKIHLGDYNSANSTYVKVGDVVLGKFSFTLPTSIPDEFLSAVGTAEFGDGVTISDPNAKMRTVSFYLFDDRDIELGSLSLEKTSGNTTHQVGYMYFDRACSMNGKYSWSDTYDSVTYTTTTSISVTATRGWNKLYQYYTESGTTATGTVKSTGIPSDLKWVIDSYNIDSYNY